MKSRPAKKTPLQRWLRNNVGFFFVLLWLVGFLVFKAYPFLSSLVYSFQDYNMFKGMKGWTLQNYRDVFTVKQERTALIITFKYAFMTVPLKLIMALFIAYILNFKIKGVNFFRTAYYIPSILGGSVAIAVLWKAMFNDDGVIHMIFEAFGLQAPHFLTNPNWALFMICLLRVWQFGSAMVIFLAALKGVPTELYEAASLDGAGKTRQFFSVTVPLIT